MAFKHVVSMWFAPGGTMFHLAVKLMRVHHMTINPTSICCNCVAFAVPSIRKLLAETGQKTNPLRCPFKTKMWLGSWSRSDLMENASWGKVASTNLLQKHFKKLLIDDQNNPEKCRAHMSFCSHCYCVWCKVRFRRFLTQILFFSHFLTFIVGSSGRKTLVTYRAGNSNHFPFFVYCTAFLYFQLLDLCSREKQDRRL